jgi:hypothetical protein
MHNAILRADIGRKTQPALQVSRRPERARPQVLAQKMPHPHPTKDTS